LLDQYVTSTDKATRHKPSRIAEDHGRAVASHPLVNEPFWFQGSTMHFTGWPDAQHTYAVPSPYIYPDNEIVLLTLQPV